MSLTFQLIVLGYRDQVRVELDDVDRLVDCPGCSRLANLSAVDFIQIGPQFHGCVRMLAVNEQRQVLNEEKQAKLSNQVSE